MSAALVMSNSRLCAQVVACDARAQVEMERARVLEVQLTEVKAESKARISTLEVVSKAQASVSHAIICAKDAELARRQAWKGAKQM